MFYLRVVTGDPAGEVLSAHHTNEQAEAARVEAVETDAENLMWYGIPDRDGVPTYAEALEYAHGFFYIEEERGNE